MALIVVTGLPCSGRTTRSRQLVQDLERRLAAAPSPPPPPSSSSSSSSTQQLPTRVLHLSDASLHMPRSSYASQLVEKPCRAAFLSHVTRHLHPSTVVVADGGAGTNIKGFRYQLWCAAREAHVRCVNVMCAASPDRCRTRYHARRTAPSTRTGEEADGRWTPGPLPRGEDEYEEATFEELLLRYEEPNAMTRWDSPLFVVSDGAASADEQEQGVGSREPWEALPFESIWEAITQGEAKKAPDVVAPTRSTTTNYLSLLESVTQSIVTALLGQLGTAGLAGDVLPVTLPSGQRAELALRLGAESGGWSNVSLSMPALQRLRRQFVRMHSAGFAATNELGQAARREGRSAAQVGTDSNAVKGQGQADGEKVTSADAPAKTPSEAGAVQGALDGTKEAGPRSGQTVGRKLAARPLRSTLPPPERTPAADGTPTVASAPSTNMPPGAGPAASGSTPEEAVARRFAVWLGETIASGAA